MVRSLLLSLPLVGVALVTPRSSQACGGCFAPPKTDTQVTGHRMILAMSQTQTSLYDEIAFSGNPESFAWVLPIHDQVDIGLSADALFNYLGGQTDVQVIAPPLNCPPPPSNCQTFGADDGAMGGGTGAGAGGAAPGTGTVTVLAQKVVGPYETVQLKASDPMALENWLSSHNYEIPVDLQPVIAAYQNEGFGFLAMKLVPGSDVKAMRPVRVTATGAGVSLPLRMVAAGTGVVTPITLHVVAEGRYQVANAPNLTLPLEQIVYHWNDGTSNYQPLITNLFTANGGQGWLTEASVGPTAGTSPYSQPFNAASFEQQILQYIKFQPGNTDWGDPANNVTEAEAAKADLDNLFGTMNQDTIWLTRLHAQLSRDALAKDLEIEAEATQKPVDRYIQAKLSDGNAPKCPDYSWCNQGGGLNGGKFTGLGQSNGPFGGSGKGACAMQRGAGQEDGTATLLAGLGVAAAAIAMRRRRSDRK